jgi:peptidoglycan/xylan/chitin deacetylase (PgdA/CDA1 family)
MNHARKEPVTTFRAWHSFLSPRARLRSRARNAAVFLLSLRSEEPRGSNWIRFPSYHHVFDDERDGFAAHLRYLKNLGEIIPLDAAIEMLESGDPIDGRYFCITFDDGFKSCLTNAVPVLVDHQATAAFFLPTRYIGTSVERDHDLIHGFYNPGNLTIEFLDWDDCRQLARAGMTVGSHTVNHPRLIELSEAEVAEELKASKETIEREIGLPCDHFCCPTGRPGIDFDPDRDPAIARRLGYRSFLTTRRGSIHRKPEPLSVDRDHMLAAWHPYQLRYFLSR